MAKFKYKTGKEIAENRLELKKALNDSEYGCKKNAIIYQINHLWENYDVEKSLIKNKIAGIEAAGIDELDLAPDFINNSRAWKTWTEYRHLIDLEKSIRRKYEPKKIQIGRYSLFDITGLRPGFPPASKDEGYEIIQDIMSFFGINNISIFNELMEEYGFEWDIKLNITETSPFPMDSTLLQSFFLLFLYPFIRKTYIQHYNWMLEIKLKEPEEKYD